MEPDRWQRVERIYHAAMQCEPTDRNDLLDEACGQDATLRTEVESLLIYGASPVPFLEKPAFEVLAEALAEDIRDTESKSSTRMIGTRIAQYRIVDKLGSGGMGEVFRAVRADDLFEKHVAIKLVRQGLDSEFMEARFRRERQILAGFEHENIARLLDGGTTDEGHPYFVMELVEGKPIDEYCDDAKLGTSARLALFRSVCSAVEYAHRRLVVHRDIKPSNILVTADGVPKLLDFGIATILTPETYGPESVRTEMTMRIMTPQFASPEQLQGKLITTAADVYSLGVVLYRLLTGQMPYRTDSNSPYDLALAVCETAPEKPSSAVRRQGSSPIAPMNGTAPQGSELQHPAPEASRSTPEVLCGLRGTTPDRLRRTLSGDLDHILLKALRKEPEHRYASAREFADDLRSYECGLPVLARRGTFAYRSGKFIRRNRFILAITAVFVLIGLIGIAVIVREAQVARMQEVRAERRFNDLRSLANSLLFEIHDSIRDLPGSTSARKLLVDRALHYLDSLSQESADTPGLQQELAAAYERVGDVQGNPYFANLGDTAGAIASYRKALNIRLALAHAGHASYDDRNALVGNYLRLGLGLEAASDFTNSLQTFQHAYPIAEALALEKPNDAQAQEMLAGVCFSIASVLSDTGNIAGSLDYYRKSAAIREHINSGSAAFKEQVQTRLAGVYGYMAGDLNLQGDLGASIALERKAHDILARVAALDPQNARIKQFLLENDYWTANYMAQKGLWAQALPYYRTALAGYLQLSSADAQDVLAMRYMGKCYVGIGAALAATGKPDQGIQTGFKALQIFDHLASADQGDNFFKPVDLAYARSALADSYQRMATTSGISQSAKIANWRAARSWYEQSLATWSTIKQRAQLGQFDTAQPGKIEHQIATCKTALAALHAGTP
jgi:serine/threonine protein kinase